MGRGLNKLLMLLLPCLQRLMLVLLLRRRRCLLVLVLVLLCFGLGLATRLAARCNGCLDGAQLCRQLRRDSATTVMCM